MFYFDFEVVGKGVEDVKWFWEEIEIEGVQGMFVLYIVVDDVWI